MKPYVPCCVRRTRSLSKRPAMTLIEVVAGIALLGTVLATTVLAQARILRQHQRALVKLQAVEAVDRLLAQWSTAGQEIPANSRGMLLSEPPVYWQTRRLLTQTDGSLRIDVVECTATASSDSLGLPPLVRLELAVPAREVP